jgi:hypothetical protein
MKVRIDQDEFWPWHYFLPIDDHFGTVYEVDDPTAERWANALSEAAKVQEEVSKFIGYDQ